MIEEINPVDSTAMKGPPCGRTEHPEADGFITPTDEDEEDFDVELTDAPTPSYAPAPSNTNQNKKKKKKKTKGSAPSGGASAAPSGGASASTSGGASAAPSGGASASRRGGNSTEPSGSLPLPPPTDGGKNKADSLKAQLSSRMLPGGGANSGIPKSMLLAGEGTNAQKAKWKRYETDDSKPLDQYAQNNINSSIISRSTDPEAWAKQGHLLFRTCNNGGLVEPMISHCIQVKFDKQFWLHSTCKASDGRPLIGPYKGTILDVVLKANLPLQVKILVDVPNKKANGKQSHYITEVLISQDPTVDGTKPMHKNCLREAIMDTYPRARDDPNYTIQDLINDAIEKDLYKGPKAPAATEEDGDDSPGPSTSKEPASKGRQQASNKTRNKCGRKAAEEVDDSRPKKAKLNNYSPNYALKAGV